MFDEDTTPGVDDAAERERRARDLSFRRFVGLIRSFPSLRSMPIPVPGPNAATAYAFDAIEFARSNAPRSSGEKDAALFVLSVWDSSQDWAEFGLSNRGRGRFELHSAMSNWDVAHRAAFVAWAATPFWM